MAERSIGFFLLERKSFGGGHVTNDVFSIAKRSFRGSSNINKCTQQKLEYLFDAKMFFKASHTLTGELLVWEGLRVRYKSKCRASSNNNAS